MAYKTILSTNPNDIDLTLPYYLHLNYILYIIYNLYTFI